MTLPSITMSVGHVEESKGGRLRGLRALSTGVAGAGTAFFPGQDSPRQAPCLA